VTSAIGSLAISGFARTSDYRTWAGGAAGGATSVYGLTVNDDTGGPGIAATFFAEVFHEAGAPGISEIMEFTPSSKRAVANLTPNTGITGGAVIGANFSSAFRTGYAENLSCAISLGNSVGANAAKWQQLIIVPSPEAASGVNTSVGTSGGGIFADLPRLCAIRWFGAAAAPFTGELWADINGLRFTGVIRDQDGNVRVRKNRNVGANYVLVAADSDTTLIVNGAFTTTFNTGVFPVGTKLRVYNNHSASITLTQGSGVTLRITGSSGGGSRSLASYTMCEAEQIATDIWHLENAT
jgi:hypothetical protein